MNLGDLRHDLDEIAGPPHPADERAAHEFVTRARRQQRRRRTVAGVTACVVATAAIATIVTVTDQSPTPKMISPATSSQSYVLECPNARPPRFGDGDGLPAKGNTDRAYVSANLAAARQSLATAGVLGVTMEPRNGQVWSYDATGAVQVEQLDDWQFVVELDSTSRCPHAATFYNGTPVSYLARVPAADAEASGRALRWSILPRQDDSTITSIVSDGARLYAAGSVSGADGFGTDTELESLRLGESFGNTAPRVFATPSGFYVAGLEPATAPDTVSDPGVLRAHVTRVRVPEPNQTELVESSSSSFGPEASNPKSVASFVSGIAGHDGTVVAVGAVYTADPRSASGMSPALWTINEDMAATPHGIDLGAAADASLTGIRWWHGRWVADGTAGGRPTVWTSKDLKRWAMHHLPGHGVVNIDTAGPYLFSSGQSWVGPASALRSAPTVWRSADGLHWQRVLRGGSNSGGRATFRRVAEVDGQFLAVGVTDPADDSGPFVSTSSDGRAWKPMSGQGTVLPPGSTVTGTGTFQGQLVLFGHRPDNGLGPDTGSWPVTWVIGPSPETSRQPR